MGARKDTRKTESGLYAFLRALNDVLAIINGKPVRRVGRRAYGRAAGRGARKLFG